MPNPFLDDEAADEAFDDDHEEEEEEEEEEDVRTDLDGMSQYNFTVSCFNTSTEFSDEETMQDHDKLQLLEDKPHHMRYNEWLETLASISNKYERSSTTLSQGIVDVHRLPQLQNSTERDDLRAAVNQVPDSQLRGILRLDEGPSFWRLKCKVCPAYSYYLCKKTNFN
jgi:hypothetical protein